MRNKEPIGIELPELLKMKPKELVELLPRMSCEELLTLRIMTESRRVCMAIQREFVKRVEPGDGVEVIRGFEKVVKVSGNFLWVEDRNQRYGASTTGFYLCPKDDPSWYCEDLENVYWMARKEPGDPSKSRFLQTSWNLTIYDDVTKGPKKYRIGE